MSEVVHNADGLCSAERRFGGPDGRRSGRCRHQGLTGGNEAGRAELSRRWLTFMDAVDAARIGDCWPVKVCSPPTGHLSKKPDPSSDRRATEA